MRLATLLLLWAVRKGKIEIIVFTDFLRVCINVFIFLVFSSYSYN